MNIFARVLQDWKEGNSTKGKFIAVLFRSAHIIRNNKFLLVFLFWYLPVYNFFIHWILGVEIYSKTIIGHSLKLWHAHALVVHPDTKIGNNCTLRQCTTIGTRKGRDGSINQFAPIIGNNVDIGANVVVIGQIVIGDNVTIGAGSVVIRDIPANSTVVGNPARVI